MSGTNKLDLSPKGIQSVEILPRVISSEALLGGTKQALILHQGHTYQLRITKLGKLILTK